MDIVDNSALINPARLVNLDSRVGHIPFLSWLVSTQRPNVIVALGAYADNSYGTFCQAIIENSLPAKAFAVEPWQRDGNRFSEESNFQEYRAYHDSGYGHFSVVIRKTFDEALAGFADGSVDLLHIDGFHSYQYAKHAFETWLPKLSVRGVVLFNDTAVDDGNVGIRALWEELRLIYPGFNFKHGNGLGVLLVGWQPESSLEKRAGSNQSDEEWQITSQLFQALGQRFEQQILLDDLQEALLCRNAQIESMVKDRDCRLSSLEQSVAGLNQALHDLDTQIAENAAIRRSLSWRITQPLRWVRRGNIVRRVLSAILRRASKLIPLSPNSRTALKFCCYGNFPATFEGTPPFELWKAQHLAIPRFGHPVVSIIIPVYGQFSYTWNCLKSLADMASRFPFEIIVVNDCSPDDTTERLKLVKGIQVLSNLTNIGFIRSCNKGAQSARGEFLVFLNNDTEVQEGWLDALIGTFSAFPNAGLVGSKLLYPDGRLQEAGGLIWNDASGWNFGRLDDPQKPEFNYVRDVDYCSGASIAIKRELFGQLGGFDERYIPAYFEDSDLAFAVRNAGYRVLYQPESMVVHFEGITSGTDINYGTKAHQVTNRLKFLDKWKERLSGHRNSEDSPFLERDRFACGHVLIIDATTPGSDASSMDAFFLQQTLAGLGYKVVFIPGDLVRQDCLTRNLQQLGVECHYRPYLANVTSYLENHGQEFDIIFVRHAEMGQKYIRYIKRHCPQAKVIFCQVNPWGNKAENVREIELELMRICDMTIVNSEAGAEKLFLQNPDLALTVLPSIGMDGLDSCTDGTRRIEELLKTVGGRYGSADIAKNRLKWLYGIIGDKFKNERQIAFLGSLEEFNARNEGMTFTLKKRAEFERSLLLPEMTPFVVAGRCRACGCEEGFVVDYLSAHMTDSAGVLQPNWRETMVCMGCGLNNRVRTAADLFLDLLKPSPNSRIYATEQLTPFFKWLLTIFPDAIGSEYLGEGFEPGSLSEGLRHEDLTQLSFEDSSLDFIFSFDVFEHVPNYQKALAECLRVLVSESNSGLSQQMQR